MISEPEYCRSPHKLFSVKVDDMLRRATVENVPETLSFLEGISLARRNRNLVAHFAGKRFHDKEVYVFVSKSDKDAQKVGLSLGVGHVHRAVAGRSEFWEMTAAVGQIQLWLANKYGEWERRYARPQVL